ncbi:MAG TPA: hypothetical protein PLX06_06370, partial [Fimbriimonadaceae bacterium]|nr:hypothetical protein [Fimbriimonadaceae bacterium]
LYAVAASGSDLPKIEAAIDKLLAEVRDNGVTEAELNRARSSYIADYIYENDDQASLARRYGWGLALGRSVGQIEGWPEALKKVTVDDIKAAAATYLDLRRSVTGYLTPSAANARAEQPAPKSRSICQFKSSIRPRRSSWRRAPVSRATWRRTSASLRDDSSTSSA